MDRLASLCQEQDWTGLSLAKPELAAQSRIIGRPGKNLLCLPKQANGADMINERPDGIIEVDFKDWTPTMMALSALFHQLPLPPGKDYSRHNIGIDRLAHSRFGKLAISLLYTHAKELEFCPTAKEVIRLGMGMLEAQAELNDLRRSRKASRVHLKEQDRWRGPTTRFGFVRGK
jgi:hypothetical protein